MSESKTKVKYFAAILTSDTSLLPDVLSKLKDRFGEIDHKSDWVPFTFTDFYEEEMGKDLKRCIVSFEKILPSQSLPKAKKWTQEVENDFKTGENRKVNIDAGYIDYCKLVLVSGKFGGHKIALTDECFADMIMDFQKGSWRPFSWCFPDFASGIYNKTLIHIRDIFKKDNFNI